MTKKCSRHTAMISGENSTFAHLRHKFKRVGKNPAYLPKSFHCLFSGQWLKPHAILLEPEWSFLVLWTSDFKHWNYLDPSAISCSFWILSQSNQWLQSHCNTDFLPWIDTKHFLIRFLVLGRISSLSILLTGTLKYQYIKNPIFIFKQRSPHAHIDWATKNPYWQIAQKNGKERKELWRDGEWAPKESVESNRYWADFRSSAECWQQNCKTFCLNTDKRHENPIEDSVHVPSKGASMSLAALYFSEDISPQSMYWNLNHKAILKCNLNVANPTSGHRYLSVIFI